MLTLQQIINEADIIVPNVMTTADKVAQLNSINQDFFNVVKIPKIANFTATKGQPTYTLDSDVRAKNIDYVKVGLLLYLNLQQDSPMAQNNYSFSDDTKQLTLNPAPYRNGIQGIVRYHRIGTTVFSTTNRDVTPDAPQEYHSTYVPALCAYLALQQDDTIKASIYEAQYKTAWNVAAANYQKE